jgi:hypothetical protein
MWVSESCIFWSLLYLPLILRGMYGAFRLGALMELQLYAAMHYDETMKKKSWFCEN